MLSLEDLKRILCKTLLFSFDWWLDDLKEGKSPSLEHLTSGWRHRSAVSKHVYVLRVAAWNFRQLEFPFYRKQGFWAETRQLVCSLLSCNKPGNLRDPFQLKRGFWMDWMDYQTTFFSLASLCGESLNTAPLEAVLVMEGCHLVNSYYWKPISHVQYFWCFSMY